MNLKDYIAEVKDFPKPGISFKDVTPIMEDPAAFKHVTKQFAEYGKSLNVDVIVGPEARGFWFGIPTALELGVGFVPVRKPKKLPRATESATYDLEYGTDTLCIHKDSIKPGQKVLITDDLLATGGTLKATIELIERLGGTVAGCAFVIELPELVDRKGLASYNIMSLEKYSEKEPDLGK